MLCATLLVAPLLALHGSGDASAAPDRPVAAGGAGPTSHRTSGAERPAPVTIAEAPVRQVTATTLPPPTTTSTVPPTTTTTSSPPTTTTTTTTTAPVAQATATGAVRTTGAVTYYDHPAGRCASPRLPFGTVVWVTNPANGATVTCTVDDREADTERSIDLATATFAELAPLSQGVIDATLSW